MTTHAMQGVAGLVCVSVVDQVMRASQPVISAAAFNEQRLPTDPIGTHTLTLSNVVVGSRVHIRDQADTTTLHDAIAAAATVVIPLSVYAAGSPLNNWRIKVRKASAAPYYIPYETLLTANVGASSIYVSQIPDE